MNDIFPYWNSFLHEVYRILWDMLRDDREGNWEILMSAFKSSTWSSFYFLVVKSINLLYKIVIITL